MAEVKFPPRPAALPISKSCVYKEVDGIYIPIDIYLPTPPAKSPLPIALYIHGGGWTGCDRSDYSKALFGDFLNQGFIVASMDYRLLPETQLSGQLEDIRDVEPWLRTKLPFELKEESFEVDVEKIVVVGGSAGAHLALLTPKLFSKPPLAILSLYGPTNMLNLRYPNRGALSKAPLPPMTPKILALATDFANPPTATPVPISPRDFLKPRALMSIETWKREVVAEFLLRCLIRGENGELSLPVKGSVTEEEVKSISPLHLLEIGQVYPPTYQIMGTEDEMFDVSHVTEFDAALKKKGVESKTLLAPGIGHAFDAWVGVGDEADVKIIKPAVDWIAGFVGVQK